MIFISEFYDTVVMNWKRKKEICTKKKQINIYDVFLFLFLIKHIESLNEQTRQFNHFFFLFALLNDHFFMLRIRLNFKINDRCLVSSDLNLEER